MTVALPNLAQRVRERKAGVRRKPLRSFKELCAELGVPENFMRGKLSSADAPAPLLVNRRTCNGPQNSWYDPDEFRAWWKTQEERG